MKKISNIIMVHGTFEPTEEMQPIAFCIKHKKELSGFLANIDDLLNHSEKLKKYPILNVIDSDKEVVIYMCKKCNKFEETKCLKL